MPTTQSRTRKEELDTVIKEVADIVTGQKDGFIFVSVDNGGQNRDKTVSSKVIANVSEDEVAYSLLKAADRILDTKKNKDDTDFPTIKGVH